MTWRITIAMGDDLSDAPHTWTIDEDPEDVDVSPNVLEGLKFGWSMPNTGVWPVQPNAMVATLSLLLPAFYDYGDLCVGQRLSLEFQLDTAGDVVAAFYGRITDLKGTPAGTTPDIDEPGVILDVTAIDYTVDLLELGPGLDGPLDSANIHAEAGLVQRAFGIACGDYLPPDDASTPTVWTSPDPDRLITTATLDTLEPRKTIDTILNSAIDDVDHTRMIFAPIIDADGQSPDGRAFTLDTVDATLTLPDVDFTVDASQVDVNVEWGQAKGDIVDRVSVNHTGATTTYPPVSFIATDADRRAVIGTIETYLPDTDTTDSEAVAAFYWRDPADLERWQLPTVSWFLDLLDSDDIDSFPSTLFPLWRLTEGDADRAACYSTQVRVAGLEDSVVPWTPYADPVGLIVGAELLVADGRPQLTLSLRYLQQGE